MPVARVQRRSRLPSRVMHACGMRPSPTVATAKTGLGRSPQGTKTRSGSGDQRLPLEGKLPKRSLHFVQRSSPRRLMRCFDLYSAAGVRARSFPPHPADSAGICFTSPLKGKAKVLLQPGSKRSPHSVRRSSGRTPRTRSGLRSATGLGPRWGPVRPTDATAENSAGHVPPARSAAFPAESTGLLPARTK